MSNAILDKDIAALRELSLLFGPTGFEGEVAEYIKGKIADRCDSCVVDRMGNLIALIRTGDVKSENRTKVMVSAHMDEVGFMITDVCDDGFLRFSNVGGINVSVLEGRRVTLGDEGGKISGVIMSKAIHHVPRSDRAKANKIDKLYIDIGAKDKEEAEKYVSVGSFGTFDSEFYLFGEDDQLIKGKALDDRMGCAAMIEVMGSVYNERPEADLDIYFCFTVREEIGLSGAEVAANKIAPNLSIVLESTAIGDIPSAAASKRVADVGKGGVLSIADRSTIYDRAFVEFALATGKEKNIPVQIKRYVSGGNDAGHIHKSGVGVRCLALSVPTRYLHSASCVASVSDFRSVRDLVLAMLCKINGDNP